MQAHALKMQAWAEEEKEKATTPRELNASVESGNKAMYALYLADQAYRAHPSPQGPFGANIHDFGPGRGF